MPAKLFALSVGCLYTTFAVVGLFLTYAHTSPEHASLAVGMLPISPLHNLVHLTIGLSAFLVCTNVTAATSMARGLCLFLGFAAVVGLLPPGAASATSMGLISTDGIWLHAVTALLAAYVGFAPMPRPRKRMCGAAVAA